MAYESNSSASDRPAPETTDILSKLIGFQTVSRDSNLDLIDWIEGYLEDRGITCRRSAGDDPGKANLFATLGSGEGGLVLSGHTDVVPVDDQDWSSDPFVLTERDGRFYGRGTCDMKGFIAVVLAKADLLKQAAEQHQVPIHFAFSFDEEVGCLGVRHLIDDLNAQGIRPAGCIIGEPTSMKTVVGHKSGAVYTCDVFGREVHSSLAPQGVNAVEYASKIIVKITEMAADLKAREDHHDGFEIPYSTMQTGVMHGGHASNIVPSQASFRFDIRALPQTRADDIVEELRSYCDRVLAPKMREVAPDARITIRKKGEVPGFIIADDAPLTHYVQRLNRSNQPPELVTFGTEGGLFQKAGVPCVICGPGSISQAHKADEYVALSQLAACEAFMDRLAAAPYKVPA